MNEKIYDLDGNLSTPAVKLSHKRKTPHILNRFLSDSYKSTNLQLIKEVATANGLSSDENHLSSSSTEYAKSSLRDLLMNPKRMVENNNSTCSNNNKSMRSSFSLDELSTSLNSASIMHQYTNDHVSNTKTHEFQTMNSNVVSTQLVSHKSPKKVNFGDISSLI